MTLRGVVMQFSKRSDLWICKKFSNCTVSIS
jgi:hypothetical protein